MFSENKFLCEISETFRVELWRVEISAIHSAGKQCYGDIKSPSSAGQVQERNAPWQRKPTDRGIMLVLF